MGVAVLRGPAAAGGTPPARAKGLGVTFHAFPGTYPFARSTISFTVDRVYYEPWRVEAAITLDQLSVRVMTAAASGVARLGIAEATQDWQPGALVLDAGEVSTATTGHKAVAISQALEPGLYLGLVLCGVAAPILDTWQCASPLGIRGDVGNYVEQINGPQAYGAFPADPPDWDSWSQVAAGTTFLGFRCALLPRWVS